MYVWPEWIACSPLIIYSTIMITNDPLSKTNIVIMATSQLSVFFGFAIIVCNSMEAAIICLVVSIFLAIPMNLLLLYNPNEEISNNLFEFSYEINTELYTDLGKLRSHLSIFLCAIFPMFSIVYICAAAGAISNEVALVCFNLLSFAMKGIYVELSSNKFLLLSSKVNEILHQEYIQSDARRSFIKFLFHEVRTPFNTISIGIDLLQESNTMDTNNHKYLKMMRESCHHVSDILDSVLTMQKIEEGKFELVYQFCDIRNIVNKAYGVMESDFTRKKIKVKITFAENTPSLVYLDGKRIEHVIINLLSNAIKFSPDNEAIAVNITFEYRNNKNSHSSHSSRSDESNKLKNFLLNTLFISKIIPLDGSEKSDDKLYMIVTVTDNGPGISKENKRKLFKMFSQVNAESLNDGSGFGLGLSFCKNIIKLHGGRISVHSIEGRGATFKFSLPIQRYEYSSTKNDSYVQNHGDFESIISSHKYQSESNESKRMEAEVLIVDDSPLNRKMLKQMLFIFNMVSEEAENGEEAIKLVRARTIPYKVIFMDSSMPKMDGITCVKYLRKQLKYNSIITGLTGNALENDIQKFIESGVNYVFTKPLSKEKLRKLVFYVRNNNTNLGDVPIIENENGFEIKHDHAI
jgi:signal transduction histidine kinase/ActR/RegA family two-component response regulator